MAGFAQQCCRPLRVMRAWAEAVVEGRVVRCVQVVGYPALASALVFAEQAKAIGVSLKVRQVDQATFDGPQHDQWQLSTGGTIGAPFLASAMHIDAPFAVANKTHFNDPQFSELFLQAMAQPDLAKRSALVHQAQQIQYERGGLLIWGYVNLLDAFSRQVGGAAAEQTLFSTWRFDNLWLRGQA